MNEKRMVFIVGIITFLLVIAVAALAAPATANYHKPAKYHGLKPSVSKADLFNKPKVGPCQKLFPKKCTSSWDTLIGDRNTGKAYTCACPGNADPGLPDLKEENEVCFKSITNAQKAKPGYRVQKNCPQHK